MKFPMFVVIANGEYDQTVETEGLAKREARDLREMGCKVKIARCDNEAELYEAEEKYQRRYKRPSYYETMMATDRTY